MNSEKQSTNLQMTLREVNRVGERQKNVPKIRFKGYEDAWEQRKLGDLCERVVRKNKNFESDLPLTIASQYGLIDQRNFFGKVVAAKDMSNYYLLKKGEFAYNKSYSKGFDFGSIKRLNNYEQGCLSTLYICFKISSNRVESDYLEVYFDTLNWYKDVMSICAEGARNHGLLNVDTKAFFEEVNVDTPQGILEQKNIALFLEKVDQLITLHQRKYDALKSMKKTLLSKMFPKNGEDVPEIRFKGFTDAWEQRKLEEFLKERTERAEGDEELLSVTINKGVIRQLESDKKNNSSENKSNYKLVYKGDIPYNSMRMWQGAVGVSQFEGIVSPAYTVLIPTEEADGKFLMELFKKSSSLQIFTRWSQGLTSDTWNLKYPTLSKISFFVPYIKEQNKIAKLLQELDDLITLHQRKLDELKNMKKTLLQQMFV